MRSAQLFATTQRPGGYDTKRLSHVLQSAGIENAHFADDAMIAAHLLDPSRGFADAEDAVTVLLGNELPPDAAAHADAAGRLIDNARAELEKRGQLALYEDLEMPLAPVLGEDGTRRRRHRSHGVETLSANASAQRHRS